VKLEVSKVTARPLAKLQGVRAGAHTHGHQQLSAAGLDDPYPGKVETMVTPEEAVN
jgi:hypothetical protein